MILKSVFTKLFKIREEASKARPGADQGFDPMEKPFLDHLEDLRTTLFQMGATLLICTILCFVFHVQIFEFLQLPAKITKMEEGGTLWDKIDFIVLAPPEILMLMLKVSFFTAVVISMPLLVYFLFQFILPGLRQVEKKMIIPGAGIGFALFLVGASFAFFMAAPIALKFFFVFQNERIGDLNPAVKALESPIAEMPLIGVGGREIAPVSETKAKPDEAGNPGEAPKPGEAAKPPENPKPEKPDDDGPVDSLPVADEPLSPEMKSAVRGYMIDLLAVQQGQNFVLRYDEGRDKIILAYAKGAKATYQIGKYFEFITRLTLVFGLSFQLPVVVTILVKLELLTARVMRSTRTYAWVIIMISAAILTPPDIITLSLLAGPMIILYEICVIIASIIERKREKEELAEEEKRRSRMERLYTTPSDELSEEEKAELHKHEIEQYEKEHAHLYDDDGHEYDEHGHLIGYDPDHDNGDHEHDESWHDDQKYWHDGVEEGDEPVDDDHKDEEEPAPVQDWPDRDSEPDAESDHAEPTGDETGESDVEEDSAAVSDDESSEDEPGIDDENCEPSGPVVDVNHATLEELMGLSGVDEWLGNMIIDHRPYESFEDLEEIVGDDKVMEWMERLMIG